MTFVSSNDPDTIGVEFTVKGNGLFDLAMTMDGEISIIFDEIENAEFALDDLHTLLQRGELELKNWHRRLSESEQLGIQP